MFRNAKELDLQRDGFRRSLALAWLPGLPGLPPLSDASSIGGVHTFPAVLQELEAELEGDQADQGRTSRIRISFISFTIFISFCT